MKTIVTQELFDQIVIIQDLAAKRGLEYIYASGDEHNGDEHIDFKNPEHIDFSNDSVYIIFEENTRHDCPYSRGVTLTINELMLSDEEWRNNMENVKTETKRKKEIDESKKQEIILAYKRRQLENLKTELGEI